MVSVDGHERLFVPVHATAHSPDIGTRVHQDERDQRLIDPRGGAFVDLVIAAGLRRGAGSQRSALGDDDQVLGRYAVTQAVAP
jgi:hypothetical protein